MSATLDTAQATYHLGDGLVVSGSVAAIKVLTERLEGARRDAIIEACARAAEAQDRVGREWVRDSLWDVICKRAGANVRALLGRG